MSARFESLCRPTTPVPTRGGGGGGHDVGRGVSTARGSPPPQLQQGSAEGDLGAPSSWGFAPAESPAADAAGDIAVSSPSPGEAAGATAAVAVAARAEGVAEVAALREENASLRKELRRAKAEIKRLLREGGGGGAQARGGRGDGVVTSASTGALEGVSSGLDDGGLEAAEQGGERRRGKKSRTPRESRSRKKIDLDTARATDAVVEAVAAGGGGIARPDSGRSLEVA